MLRVSVSMLDIYREWKEGEDQSVADLIETLKSSTPTEAMLKGRAFAKAMELLGRECEADSITAEGYTFHFTGDFSVELFSRREEKAEKDYGGIVVSARCDRVLGSLIVDDKTTSQFDAERYEEKMQWRYYLDMWNANRFRWMVWECKEMDEPKNYCIHALHTLNQYRYPEMERDCRDLALDFKKFAERCLPGYPYERVKS